MKVRLKDVAARAGVAINTASTILNRRPNSWASKATEQRVFVAAEELGYHSVWINDHVVIPTQHGSKYPYSADGRPSFTPDDHFYDPFVLLASLAAHTKTIKLGSSVAVIPYRPPILTAKAIATLDQVSKGRFIFGVGVGWFAEETELLGVSFTDRAKVSRSYLNTMKALWTEERPRVSGASGSETEIGFAPKPVQIIDDRIRRRSIHDLERGDACLRGHCCSVLRQCRLSIRTRPSSSSSTTNAHRGRSDE